MLSIVKIQGGYGNQIFQLLFINYLKQQNQKVVVSTSWFTNKEYLKYENTTSRLLELNLNKLKLIEVSRMLLFLLEVLKFLCKSKFFKKILYRLKIFNFHQGQRLPDKYCLINLFEGYWQSVNLENYNFKFLEDKILEETSNNVIKDKNYDNKVLVHFRFGDFQRANKVLPIEYYQKSIDYFNNLNFTPEFIVFADEMKNLNLNSIFKHNKYMIYSNNSIENSNDLLHNFVKFKHIISSNSTLSIIAAVLIKEKGGIAVVPLDFEDNIFNVKENKEFFNLYE